MKPEKAYKLIERAVRGHIDRHYTFDSNLSTLGLDSYPVRRALKHKKELEEALEVLNEYVNHIQRSLF